MTKVYGVTQAGRIDPRSVRSTPRAAAIAWLREQGTRLDVAARDPEVRDLFARCASRQPPAYLCEVDLVEGARLHDDAIEGMRDVRDAARKETAR